MSFHDQRHAPQVGVLAVVWRDGRVLLVRRANAPQAGHWGFPGGHLKRGETLADGAVRELAEETGLAARPDCVLAPVELIGPGDGGAHFVLVPVRLSAVRGEARAGSDALEAGWFAPASLPAPLCAFVAEVVAATAEGGAMTGKRITDIRPGVAAVIFDGDGRILLHRRRVGAGWAPVSGHVEPGESLTEALHREVREETGLEVGDERLVSVNSDPAFQVVAYPDGRNVQFVTTLFACAVRGGTFRGSDEGIEWGWFAPDDLPRPLLPYARIWLDDATNLRSGSAVR